MVPAGFKAKPALYDALVVAGLDSGLEEGLRQFADRLQLRPLVLRSEEGLLWEPFGALARSVISALVRYETIADVWVLGWQGQPNDKVELARANPNRVIPYLLTNLSGLPADRWLRVDADETAAVAATSRLLRHHPLLPRPVTVRCGLLQRDGTVTPVEDF